MQQTKVIKVKIYPDKEQQELLLKSIKAYTLACDYVSEYIFYSRDLKQTSIHKNTYRQIRTNFGLQSQMACNVIRTVLASYRGQKTANKEWTRCKFLSPQMTLSWNRDYHFHNNKFSIGTLEGRIKVCYAEKNIKPILLNSEYTFGTTKIAFKHNKFFLYVALNREIEEVSNSDITNIVGHDRGIRFLITSYDSKGKTTFYNGKEIKQRRGHYKKLRQQLQKVGTPSSRQRLKAIGQRENRWMQDVNHCLSKALVENNPKGTLHVLEDLSGVRNATEKVRVKDRYVSVSWSYYDLEQKLIYKAREAGQKVIKVDPRYTSQTCSKCGHIERANRNKSQHLFCCKNCGYKSNDDRIGAMNLYRMGIEYLVELQVSTSDL